MKIKFIFLLFIPYLSLCAQSIKKTDNRTMVVSADTMLYFDNNNNLMELKAHKDSLQTGKYVVSIKTSKQKVEIHLVPKYPQLNKIIGKQLSENVYHDINGNRIKVDGSIPTIIIFWNTSCKPCIKELVALNIISREYDGFRFLALTDETKERVLKFLDRTKIELDNISIIPNYKDEYSNIIQIQTNPLGVLINKNRTILNCFVGSGIRPILRALDNFKE